MNYNFLAQNLGPVFVYTLKATTPFLKTKIRFKLG